MTATARMKNERAANFELLRILAMFGVVVNHFYNNALCIYDSSDNGLHIPCGPTADVAVWTVLELMKLTALVSVNCYVLMTGYFLATKTDLRTRGIWNTWSQTWFYSVALWIIMMGCGHVGFSRSDMLHYLTPISTNNYWFITNYLGLMLVAPFISTMTASLDRRRFGILVVAGGVLCLQYPLGHIFISPQQFLLFIYLYIIGAYIRLHVSEVPRGRTVAAFWLTLMVMSGVAVVKNIVRGDGRLDIISMEYNGLVLPLSVCVFMIFRQMKISSRLSRPIIWLAPFSLAVYLIHEHPLVDEMLWRAVRTYISTHELWILPLDVIALSAAIYAVCVAIDIARHYGVTVLKAAYRHVWPRT